MDENIKIRNSKIVHIFETMTYGENFGKTKGVTDWLKTKQNSLFSYVEKSNETPTGTPTKLQNYVNGEFLCKIYIPEIDTIKNILTKSNEKIKWIDVNAFERTKILSKLASQIEKNTDILAEIESVARGILPRDTRKKFVPLLAQYFRYYSRFAFTYPKWKPPGIAVGVISNENPLSHLGLFLAPALAAGYNVVLHVGIQLAPAAFLLQDLVKSVGIPECILKIVPSDDEDLSPYSASEKVSVLTLFVDLHSQKYRGINTANKKILLLSSYKTPAIIFDDADLDSACETIVESSWGYQSLLPWSTNTIFVQENIFSTFLNKLKSKLSGLKIGYANDTSVDIAYRSESSSSKLSLIDLAKSQGIDVFQAVENCNSWCPTLFIGGKIQTNSVLSSADNYTNAVTILAFRSIDEAVNLANNSRQGLAASLWSENIGIINEVARKLKVSNVWVNSCFGSNTADVAVCPLKDSGIGYFGGREGFLEYVEYGKPSVVVSNNTSSGTSIISVEAIVTSAKKSQENWSRVPKIEKLKIFQEFAEYLDGQKQKLNDDWVITTVSNIYESITDTCKETMNVTNSHSLMTLTEPRGIIAIDVTQSENRRLIFTALYQGNAVLLFTNSTTSSDSLKKLSSLLPNGVFNIIPYSIEAVKSIALNKLVNVYCGSDLNPVFANLPVKDSKMFTKVSDEWGDIYRKVTFLKNIWTDIGKSSTCNLN